MGDRNHELSLGANRFFLVWKEMITNLLDQAQAQGLLAERVDCPQLAQLIMCTMEGALLICKASKNTGQLKQTGEFLLQLVRGEQPSALSPPRSV